tara:strand:+ start:3669 stop:4685 length:1017 start_codon:yes stop_codon:yes gene_type:complete
MDKVYIKKEYSVKFAELAVKEEIRDVQVSFGNEDFRLSFVESDPTKKYHKQCPMNIEVISIHNVIPRKIPDILLKVSQGYQPYEAEKANTFADLVAKGGPCYGLEKYPNPLIDFLRPIQKSHSSFIKAIMTTLSYRCFDTRNLHSINKGWGLSCSFDYDNWFRLPTGGSFSLHKVESPPMINSFFENSDSIAEVITLPPFTFLPIELLSEAKKVRSYSARSSLVIAVTALEVKLKDFISRKVDGGEWLVNNLQSPPIDKILKDYIPTLVDNKDEYISLINEYMPEITNIVSVRNKITHLGHEVTGTKVQSYIDCIEKVMYLLDFQCGCQWAKPPYELP